MKRRKKKTREARTNAKDDLSFRRAHNRHSWASDYVAIYMPNHWHFALHQVRMWHGKGKGVYAYNVHQAFRKRLG